MARGRVEASRFAQAVPVERLLRPGGLSTKSGSSCGPGQPAGRGEGTRNTDGQGGEATGGHASGWMGARGWVRGWTADGG